MPHPTHDAVPPEQVLLELARVLAAPAFLDARAHQRLLRHLVEQTLSGQADTLKETVLGIQVFQRPAHSFDPRRDSMVPAWKRAACASGCVSTTKPRRAAR